MSMDLLTSRSTPVTGDLLYDDADRAEALRESEGRTHVRLDVALDPVLRDRVRDFDADMGFMWATARKSFTLFAEPSEPGYTEVVLLESEREPVLGDPIPTAPVAVTAVQDVLSWTGLKLGEVLAVAGVAPSTYHSWPNLVRQPRAGSEGRLWEVHLLMQGIVEVKGGAVATAMWLKQHPEVVADLKQLHFDEVASAAYVVPGLAMDPARALRGAWAETRSSLDVPANAIDWANVADVVAETEG